MALGLMEWGGCSLSLSLPSQFSRWVIDVDLEMSLLKGLWGSVGVRVVEILFSFGKWDMMLFTSKGLGVFLKLVLPSHLLPS
jgi:hypothetical protein